MRTGLRLCSGVVAASLVAQLTACGTLLYPDRRGQIEGRIDPAVAALNALGLLIYVIPGLIAFGVDFATGAIYLPDDRFSVAPEVLQDAIGADGQVDLNRLQQLIEERSGRRLPLDHPNLIQRHGSPAQLAALGLAPAA